MAKLGIACQWQEKKLDPLLENEQRRQLKLHVSTTVEEPFQLVKKVKPQ